MYEEHGNRKTLEMLSGNKSIKNHCTQNDLWATLSNLQKRYNFHDI